MHEIINYLFSHAFSYYIAEECKFRVARSLLHQHQRVCLPAVELNFCHWIKIGRFGTPAETDLSCVHIKSPSHSLSSTERPFLAFVLFLHSNHLQVIMMIIAEDCITSPQSIISQLEIYQQITSTSFACSLKPETHVIWNHEHNYKQTRLYSMLHTLQKSSLYIDTRIPPTCLPKPINNLSHVSNTL